MNNPFTQRTQIKLAFCHKEDDAIVEAVFVGNAFEIFFDDVRRYSLRTAFCNFWEELTWDLNNDA